MNREYLDYVEDILDAMEKAEIIVRETSHEKFLQDFRINFAVVRALEIIGEATKRLSADIREQYPEIPWKDMAGMRDRIIHGYDNVDLEIVWDTVKKEIPKIKPLIQNILNDRR
ncbi:MAG: DUF86 domain-containing protein [Desulfococcaceae bacterium]